MIYWTKWFKVYSGTLLLLNILQLKTLITFLFSLTSIIGVNAQRLVFEHYNDEMGLSHNSVRHIVQDNKGFLWLGTFSGLNRFDGYQFKSYSTALNGNTLNNDDITALELDQSHNNLWIGTRNGLTVLKLDTHEFKTFLSDENNLNGLEDSEIRALYVDKFERVWVGTKKGGVFLFYPREERFEKVDIEGFEYVKEIFVDKSGKIWIGSYREGLARIELDHQGEISGLTKYTLAIPNSTEKNPYINFIYEDFKSDIFIGTREGLYKLDYETNTFINQYIKDNTVRNSLGPYFLSVARAPDGKYWIGTLGGLLVCKQFEDIENGNFEWHRAVITEESSLIDNQVYALYFDASGVLWIGTEDGLDKYDPFENQFRTNNDISLHINNLAPRIIGFSKTYDSKVVVATRHNGLFISKDDGFVPLYDGQNDIASIYSEDGRTFYCGLWNGNLLVYNYQDSSSLIVSTGIENSAILSIEKYNDNEIIIGYFGNGISVLDKESLQIVIPAGTIIPKYQVTKIVNNGNGELWIATQQGAVKFNIDTKSIKIYRQKSNVDQGLPHDNVNDILIDSKQNIWAATRKGLAKYDAINDWFYTIEGLEEIDGIWVTNLVEDNTGNLWLNLNNNKMAKYNISLSKLNIYHVNSGNRLDIFSSSGFYNFNGSRIYLGGKNGIISFSPHEIKENEWSPTPLISEFKIQGKEILPNTKVNGQIPMQSDLNYKKEIELDYRNRNFSIQFSTPSFSNERLNKFQYKLEGFDEDWVETNSDARTIQYANLSPNDYVFKIKARNNDGHWSKTATYSINVLPPFWLTYQGVFLSLLLLTVLGYFIMKQLRYRLELKKAFLEERIKRERDEKLNNEKLRFFTNISHELRTPLTLILGPAKQMLEGKRNNSYEKSRINLIHQNANRLLRLVNQILDFRRAEAGELKLKVVKTDILLHTKNVFSLFIELAESKNINFNLNFENETIEGWIDLDKYNNVLYNLLSNAIKFTNNHGNVDLFVGVEEEGGRTLIIEVSDDGIGIPADSGEKIFTRFYQANNGKEITTGTGIGLSLVNTLVKIHKGEISFDSTPNLGSVFIVKLPIYEACFDKEELFDSSSISSETFKDVRELKVKKIKNNLDVKHKILIIEDNLELRKYLVDFLSDHYKVYEAANGNEGLEMCRKVRPILCVVDVMMPEMDGFEYVQALKNDEIISHTAIILLTALAESENRIIGYSIGVDGYLVKPFDPTLLKTRIENIIKLRANLKLKFSGEAEGDIGTLAHSPIDVEFMSRIKAIIEENIDRPEFKSKCLSDEMAMSPSKLYRKIIQITDVSPKEFIRIVRLKKSVQLLKTQRYNVSEVSHMVGFNDPLYFSKCFKHQFGESPSRYIK
jgi:signal transduction histidine kinase/ligand-binding sensor domain-containing protein/DNA-binding response OmpR family regulator